MESQESQGSLESLGRLDPHHTQGAWALIWREIPSTPVSTP